MRGRRRTDRPPPLVPPAQSCYAKIYGDDPLEEGELDTRRGPMFRECASRDLRTPERQGDLDAVDF